MQDGQPDKKKKKEKTTMKQRMQGDPCKQARDTFEKDEG